MLNGTIVLVDKQKLKLNTKRKNVGNIKRRMSEARTNIIQTENKCWKMRGKLGVTVSTND